MSTDEDQGLGWRLDGKVAIVTGAAGGQGAATARLFVRLGARVVLTDQRADDGETVRSELGEPAMFLPLDVSVEADWERVVATTLDRLGRIDALVNNAAIHWSRPLLEESGAGFLNMLAVNLLGPFLGIRAVAGQMQQRGGGSIVNVSSTAGLNGLPGHAAYGSAKWGLRGLSKIAAVELGPSGVRVNTIVPGPINTAMMRPGDEDRFQRLPLRRPGEPWEVAPLSAFLVSDASSYITGAEITVDGGASATLGISRAKSGAGA